MNMNGLDDLYTWISGVEGASIVRWIVDLAAWLTGEGTPGLVSVFLVFVLVVLSIYHLVSTWRFRRAVGACRSVFPEEPGHITGAHLISIDSHFKALRSSGGWRRRLGVAWAEFRETTVGPERESDRLDNTVRPTLFFSREELGLERGIWRQIPGLFVSTGLFLTFLGLVAALHQTGEILEAATGDDGETTTEGLKTLLRIAGAKFIMSLTGLLCSIVFTLVLRFAALKNDSALDGLCFDIENGCVFLSEQKLLADMVGHAREQTDQLKSFGTELVAQIARPLREELPQTISASIKEAMAPAIENLSKGAGEGVQAVAGSVSEQLAGGIRNTVQAMNEDIGGVSSGLEGIARQIDQSTRTMIETTQSLQSIVQESVEKSNEAGQQASREIINAAVSAMHENLLGPVNELGTKLQDFISAIDAASTRMGEYANSLEDSGTVVNSANEALTHSAQTLTTATDPVRDAVAGIESATRAMADRVEAASDAVSRTTDHTESIMRTTREAIKAQQTATGEALGALENAVAEFRNIVERHDEIDRNLGDAFEQIETAVRSSIDEIGNFERKLNDEFGKALNRLEAVIAQAVPFEQRRSD